MPSPFSALLDTLLVLAGLVLVVTGLVMFIRSKTSTQSSSVEAFGIKLNVTHPSLILVLAGVGMMLAPRLLPDTDGKPDESKPAVVAAATAPEAPAPARATSPEPPSTAASPAEPAAASVAPSPSPAAVPARPSSPPAAPARPPAAASGKTDEAPAAARPAPKPAAKPAPAPAASKPAPAVALAKPSPPPAPAAVPAPAAPPAERAAVPPAVVAKARPTLAYAALGLPIDRAFWNGETPASYTRRMHGALQQAGREVLRMDAQGLKFDQPEFNAWWNEPGQHPRSRELCNAPGTPMALLAAKLETPTTISSADSAYWPELKLRLFVCASQRVYRQQKTLTPQNNDAWPFSIELNSEIERFLRTYRGDLVDS